MLYYNSKITDDFINEINIINQSKYKIIITEWDYDYWYYLDINKNSLFERKKSRSFQNKFDQIYLNQYERIKKNYNELTKLKIGNRKFIKINANRDPDIIHQEVIFHIKKCKLI